MTQDRRDAPQRPLASGPTARRRRAGHICRAAACRAETRSALRPQRSSSSPCYAFGAELLCSLWHRFRHEACEYPDLCQSAAWNEYAPLKAGCLTCLANALTVLDSRAALKVLEFA